MKVTCQRDSLQMACQLVAAAVPTHTTIPALKNIKATALDDALFLVAYDPTQGVGIRYELRGITVARAGACILPKDQLIQILRESTEPSISINADQDSIIAKAGGRYEMLKLDVDEFPDIPSFDDGGRYHEITAGMLRTMIRRTAFAADKKDSDGGSLFRACCGKRMARSYGSLPPTQNGWRCARDRRRFTVRRIR